ncbi:MAG: hypothetical protein AAGC60_22570 [Acidobacteriota bacterium]
MSNELKTEVFYKPWELKHALPDRLILDALYDDFEGFRLLLRSYEPIQQVLRVRFPDHLAYRNTNESERLRTWSRYRDAARCGIFQVENSRWLEWIGIESFETLKLDELRHFAVHSVEDCVDVITYSDPIVEILGS